MSEQRPDAHEDGDDDQLDANVEGGDHGGEREQPQEVHLRDQLPVAGEAVGGGIGGRREVTPQHKPCEDEDRVWDALAGNRARRPRTTLKIATPASGWRIAQPAPKVCL